MAFAAMIGTTVDYTDFEHDIVVETIDGRVIVINRETFNYLYFRLDNFTAALKGDCIEYVKYYHSKPLNKYPKWFLDAMEEGWITNEYNGDFIFLDVNGEIAMSDGSVILRNYMGDLRYMEMKDFKKYYILDGGILNEL